MHSSGHMEVLCIADVCADALKVLGLMGWAQIFVEAIQTLSLLTTFLSRHVTLNHLLMRTLWEGAW